MEQIVYLQAMAKVTNVGERNIDTDEDDPSTKWATNKVYQLDSYSKLSENNQQSDFS